MSSRDVPTIVPVKGLLWSRVLLPVQFISRTHWGPGWFEGIITVTFSSTFPSTQREAVINSVTLTTLRLLTFCLHQVFSSGWEEPLEQETPRKYGSQNKEGASCLCNRQRCVILAGGSAAHPPHPQGPGKKLLDAPLSHRCSTQWESHEWTRGRRLPPQPETRKLKFLLSYGMNHVPKSKCLC